MGLSKGGTQADWLVRSFRGAQLRLYFVPGTYCSIPRGLQNEGAPGVVSDNPWLRRLFHSASFSSSGPDQASAVHYLVLRQS
jgi:hypothetical protein